MKKSSLIGHVLEAYTLTRQSPSPADHVVAGFYKERRYLGADDRRFVSHAVYGMLRNLRLLEEYAGKLKARTSTSDDVHPLVLYCIFAMKIQGDKGESLQDDVVPLWSPEGATPDLQRFLREVESADLPLEGIGDPVKRMGVQYSHPDFVIEGWIKAFGSTDTEKLCASMNQEAPTTLRVNSLRATIEDCIASLGKEGVDTERTTFSPSGLLLKKRTNLGSLRAFKEGWFEVQDEGSQLVGFLVNPVPGTVVVDVCAGAGGKSLHLASLMRNKGVIHAWDPQASRLRKFGARAERAGAALIKIHTGNDSGILELRGSVDRLLIDAPCSGSGTFRRNPGLKAILTRAEVSKMIQSQQSILSRYDRLLKAGGLMIYATCSLLGDENEGIVEWFLSSHQDYSIVRAGEVLQQQGVDLECDGPFLRLTPHLHTTDGFFATVLRKE